MRNIEDAHVSKKHPNDNFKQSIMLKTGRGTSSGINQTYIKFQLPNISSASVITDARLNLIAYDDHPNVSNVDVHKVTSSWDLWSITWNNRASYDGTVADWIGYTLLDNFKEN